MSRVNLQKLKQLVSEISLVNRELKRLIPQLATFSIAFFSSVEEKRRAKKSSDARLFYDRPLQDVFCHPLLNIKRTFDEHACQINGFCENIITETDPKKPRSLKNSLIELNSSLEQVRKNLTAIKDGSSIDLNPEDNQAFLQEFFSISRAKSTAESIIDILLTIARTTLRLIDYMVNGLDEKKTFHTLEETPFARSIVGRSQFFPRPISTANDALDELLKLFNLLEKEARALMFVLNDELNCQQTLVHKH